MENYIANFMYAVTYMKSIFDGSCLDVPKPKTNARLQFCCIFGVRRFRLAPQTNEQLIGSILLAACSIDDNSDQLQLARLAAHVAVPWWYRCVLWCWKKTFKSARVQLAYDW